MRPWSPNEVRSRLEHERGSGEPGREVVMAQDATTARRIDDRHATTAPPFDHDEVTRTANARSQAARQKQGRPVRSVRARAVRPNRSATAISVRRRVPSRPASQSSRHSPAVSWTPCAARTIARHDGPQSSARELLDDGDARTRCVVDRILSRRRSLPARHQRAPPTQDQRGGRARASTGRRWQPKRAAVAHTREARHQPGRFDAAGNSAAPFSSTKSVHEPGRLRDERVSHDPWCPISRALVQELEVSEIAVAQRVVAPEATCCRRIRARRRDHPRARARWWRITPRGGPDRSRARRGTTPT